MKKYRNPLWRSAVHQAIWIEKWCERCIRYPGCPILGKAQTSGRKPREWDRNDHAQTMDSTLKCHSFADQHPVVRRGETEDHTLEMFHVHPTPHQRDTP